jgi:uncharacterized protein YndB with AHSA1/START domain
MIPDQIEREIIINAPVDRVWAALTEPQHLGTWFGDSGAEVDLRPGGTLTITWKEYGTARTTIERVEPKSFFSWRWTPGGIKDTTPDNTTLVEFSLVPEGAGTRLKVVESGFRNLKVTDEEKSQAFKDNTGGWQSEIDELRGYVERLAA